jgi:transmembrane sensor
MPSPGDADPSAVTDPTVLLDPVDREAHDWVTRFAAGADRAELDAFKAWCESHPANKAAFERACRLWHALGTAGHGTSGDITSAPRSKLRIARRALIGGAIAASAAYVVMRPPLGLWPSASEFTADYRTAVGQQRQVALAGGPTVALNTRTSLARRTLTNGPERLELIAGEVAITASRDMARSVEVTAATGRISASEAVFNVRYEGGEVSTTCVTGDLAVDCGTRSARLTAGEQIVYSADRFGTVMSVDPAAITAWEQGVLVFHAVPLAQAVAEINRYRAGRIIITNAALGQRLFNARFRIEHIDGVVGQIQQVFGARVTTLPAGIVLLS